MTAATHTPDLQRVEFLCSTSARESFMWGLGKTRLVFENIRGVFLAEDVDINSKDLKPVVAPLGMSRDKALQNQYLLMVPNQEHNSLTPAELRGFYDTDIQGMINYIRGHRDLEWLEQAAGYFRSKGLSTVESACTSRREYLTGEGKDLVKSQPVAQVASEQAETGADASVGTAEASVAAPVKKKRGRKPKAQPGDEPVLATQAPI